MGAVRGLRRKFIPAGEFFRVQRDVSPKDFANLGVALDTFRSSLRVSVTVTVRSMSSLVENSLQYSVVGELLP